MEKFDVIVIGAGPAGLAAARNLKESGKSVAIVENDLWGGTCPNRGCDPKKVLLSAVQARDKVIQLQEKGFSEVPNIDWTKLEAFKKTFTDPVSKGSKKSMIDADIKAIDGAAQFIDDNKISVSGVSYSADNFIIATGQRPSILDIPGKEYLQTSNEFLSLPQMPKTITFIGGGYIAFELATIANAAGAKVNIVLHNDHPLKEFDKSFALDLVDQLKNKGVNFYFNVNTKEIKKTLTNMNWLLTICI
jgi:Pyruvate/2-oxoglutarate dehydrogenase complex, dihydrolipoamide dehydrogenase (E3) component, and related enzymes